MAAGLPLADARGAASKWWVPAVQSVVLCLLFAAMSVIGLSLYIVIPAALLVAWLPLLLRRRQPGLQVEASDSDIALLTRDLSRTTSHNALSAAQVAFSVGQLAGGAVAAGCCLTDSQQRRTDDCDRAADCPVESTGIGCSQ
ncbi:Methyl-accepting chemotaxis protein [Pseudomonas amygdali pv. mori]|nr:Methyl-accepting chemotaxis protein [Pseudomonas amygdali pv. mori]RMR45639.1 Methyl-accepting chemotaxis protein [Pseudomonas amygdali pv. mori]